MNQTFQSLLFFFIESCSFIQPDDQWSYFILYEKGSKGYWTVAFSTMYEELQGGSDYVAWISQFLVLPCYQRQGFAKLLLDSIYVHYIDETDCQEINVEKPTKEFQAVRDSFETHLMLRHNFFLPAQRVMETPPQSLITKQNYSGLKLTVQELNLIQWDLKINKSRILRSYQWLLIDHIKPAHPDAVRVLKA